jgi:hypothetical protein
LLEQRKFAVAVRLVEKVELVADLRVEEEVQLSAERWPEEGWPDGEVHSSSPLGSLAQNLMLSY